MNENHNISKIKYRSFKESKKLRKLISMHTPLQIINLIHGIKPYKYFLKYIPIMQQNTYK